MLNLALILEHHARMHPEHEAVVTGTTRLTYAQVEAMACQVANGLAERGVHPGDKVALSCPNLPYFPIVYFGILKAGGVVVPLNVLLKAPEIAYHLRDSEAKAYFCFEGTEELPMGRMGRAGFGEVEGCEHFFLIPAHHPAPGEAGETLGALMEGQRSACPTAVRAPEDTAVVLYTSGTTGRPKGAELTHSNMLTNAIVSRDLALPRLEGHPLISLIALPLFHSFGQTVQMNAGFYHGGMLVLVPRFEPAVVLEAMVREKVTYFAGVPTMYWALLNHAREHSLDTRPIAEALRVCTSGGAAMPVEVLKAFEETFDVEILEGYGLSETSPVATFNQMGRPRKVGSIGLPVMGVEVRVVDPVGRDVPAGEPGEIVIRGANVMKGYYNKPQATAEAIDPDGWFHSGDVGQMDEEGYLFIVDRIKDMIIRGGFNVYPREIEEVLMKHPAVSLAAVVGVPHHALGEEVKAYVIREPGAELTEEGLIAWARERMAQFKYPRIVEFRDSLPMTATGKILKRQLRTAEAGARQESAV